MAAGDLTWAARLIEGHFDAVFFLHGEAATIYGWLSVLPEDMVRSRPRLLLGQALMAALSGRLEAVEPLLDAAERGSAGAAGEPFEPTAGRGRSLLVNVPALIALLRSLLAQLRGDADATAAFASQALAESREDEWRLHADVQDFLAVAAWLRGRLTEAERAFESSIAGWRAAGQPTFTAYALAISSARSSAPRVAWAPPLAPTSRHWRSPRRLAARNYQPPASRLSAWPRSPTSATSSTPRCSMFTDGIALCRRFVHSAPLATGLATLAWIRQATGQPGRCPGRHERGRAGCAGAARPAQPGPGTAGPTAATP